MKVSELAEQLKVESDVILATLKSLKLKAKDSKQELSPAVISVVKGELNKAKKGKIPEEKPREAKAAKESEEKAKPDKELKKTEEASKKQRIVSAQKTAKPESGETKDLKAKLPKKGAKEIKQPVVEDKKKQRDISPHPSLPSRPKMSKEPVITLKPLARKKRRPGLPGREDQSLSSIHKEKSAEIHPKLPAGNLGQKISGETSRMETPVSMAEEILREAELPEIEIEVPITVKDFSVKIQQKPSLVLMKLMKMGILANINQGLDAEYVERLTKEFGFRLVKVKTQEEKLIEVHKKQDEDPKLLAPRAPVVTFMGHVDHGKTSLLDRIRKSKVADSEHGGITQHIGAYSVNVPKGRITFLDTPGHEAFTAMRARGAHITDIVVLVIAADEGVMPQTREAIDHARAANVPIVVALNKMDHRNANADQVKKQLVEIDLTPEDWGGKTVVVGVSALTGQGVDQLLEMILLESELLELKANAQKKASGIVVEAHLSKGKGAMTTLIVHSGTLNEGDFIVVGPYYGKVRAMFNDRNNLIKSAGPSMPVEILGLADVPEAGEEFYVVEDDRKAREISSVRQEQLKNQRMQAVSKMSLEDLYSQIQSGSVKELSVIIKADVQGSLEALKDSLAKIPSDKIKLRFIHTGVGDINASDVLLAVASQAIIIAFHVDIDVRAKQELEKHPVDVRQYRIIYDAVNDVRNALEGLLEPKTRKKFVSRIEVREVFKLSKAGIVAGCYVLKGRIHRKVQADLLRNNEVIYTGAISSLKRFKDDVREVNEGMECGITIGGFDKYEPGDIIEAYELESISQKL